MNKSAILLPAALACLYIAFGFGAYNLVSSYNDIENRLNNIENKLYMEEGRKEIRAEAVERGYGEMVEDENGKTVFRWIEK